MHKICSERFLFKDEKLKDDKKILWTIVAQRTTEIPIQNGRQNDQKPFDLGRLKIKLTILRHGEVLLRRNLKKKNRKRKDKGFIVAEEMNGILESHRRLFMPRKEQIYKEKNK